MVKYLLLQLTTVLKLETTPNTNKDAQWPINAPTHASHYVMQHIYVVQMAKKLLLHVILSPPYNKLIDLTPSSTQLSFIVPNQKHSLRKCLHKSPNRENSPPFSPQRLPQCPRCLYMYFQTPQGPMQPSLYSRMPMLLQI